MAERSNTFRVCGRLASLAACSHDFATSILNRQASGTPLFLAAQDARRLVVRGVVAVGIDRSGARLQPNARRPGGLGNSFSYSECRLNPGFFDEAAILGMVSAVNAPPGQVDNDVRPINFGGPFTGRLSIPAD